MISTAGKKALPIFLVVALAVAVFFFAVPTGERAEASGTATLTITYDGQEYVYTDEGGNGGRNISLQKIIEASEERFSQTVFIFKSLTVREPLTVKNNSLMQGKLDFKLKESKVNYYALTVRSNAELIIQGLELNSDVGAIRVEYNAYLEIRSATVCVMDCERTCSAIESRGSSYITGGSIEYSAYNDAFGYGVSVNDGEFIVSPERDTPVKIAGNSGLCIAAGRAEINGGEYAANGALGGNSSAGYSLDIQDGEITVNDGQFPQPIYDRAVIGAKINVNGGNVSSVRLTPNQNKKIYFAKLEVVAGLRCELDIGFNSGTAVVNGKSGSNGYRVVGFNVDGERADEASLNLPTDVATTIAPIESNIYALSLLCDGAEYKRQDFTYGEIVKLDTLPSPEKKGYTLKNWAETSGDFIIYEDMSLNAVTVLSDTDITIKDTEFTYNGTEHTVEPILRHEVSAEIYGYWERYQNNGFIKVSDEKELKITYVKDSGRYRFTAVATYNSDRSVTQKEAVITVKKGVYEDITHHSFEGTYDPGKRLNRYGLEENFRWKNGAEVPTASKKYYTAYYNADSENYLDFEVQIKIDLKKAVVTASPHGDLSGVYEKKRLKEYKLNDNFRWENPEEIPVVKKKAYRALFNPDLENYEDVPVTILLSLIPGNYDESKRLEDMKITYKPNYNLSDYARDFALKNPNYTLEYSADVRLNAGERSLNCVYNDDKDNYNDYKFSIKLTIDKADVLLSDVPKLAPIEGVYGGLPLSAYPIPCEGFSWLNPEKTVPTVPVKEYDAIYNPDRQNYNDLNIKLTLNLEKGSYRLDDVTMPVLNEVVYDKDRTLKEVSLPQNWAWQEPSVIPTVTVGEYKASFLGDPENYLPLTVFLPLKVNKADIENAVLPDKTVTYDGKEHSLIIESLSYPLELVGYENNAKTDAGKYEVTAKLRQMDVENYKLHPSTVRGMLTILKAPSVIIAPIRYDIIEGSELVIDGAVENDEQNLIIPEFTETAVGVYTVILTTAESGNYKAGELAVTVSINKGESYVGNIKYPDGYDGSFLYGILLNSDSGVPNGAEITFRAFDRENLIGMEISVTLNGEKFEGKFTAKVLMTDKMLAAKALILFDGDGNQIPFTVENGVYLVFSTDGDDIFYLSAEYDEKGLKLYWIPIGIAIGLILIGLVIVILWKKGILPKNKKRSEKKTAEASNLPEADVENEGNNIADTEVSEVSKEATSTQESD